MPRQDRPMAKPIIDETQCTVVRIRRARELGLEDVVERLVARLVDKGITLSV